MLAALSATACLQNLWPDDERTLAGCESERLAPGPRATGPMLSIGATDDRVDLHAVDIEGSGTDFVGRIRLSGGIGSIRVGCRELTAAVFDRDDTERGVFYHLLAVDEERIYVIDLSCDDSNTLDDAWYVGTDGVPRGYEPLGGTCRERDEPNRASVKFPEISLPAPEPVSGYTISGPDITLSDSGGGKISFPLGESEIIAYDAEACGDDCETPWFFLSALIRNEDRGTVTVGRIWLDEAEEDEVFVYNAVTLPGFFVELDVSMPATFTTP